MCNFVLRRNHSILLFLNCVIIHFSFLKESSESTEITERIESTVCNESNESTECLQQIFPCKSREELAEIMRSSSSLEEATNRLLDAENILLERGMLPIIFEVNLRWQ